MFRTIFLLITVLLALAEKAAAQDAPGQEVAEEIKQKADEAHAEMKEIVAADDSAQNKISQLYKFFMDNLADFIELCRKFVKQTWDDPPEWLDKVMKFTRKLYESLKGKVQETRAITQD